MSQYRLRDLGKHTDRGFRNALLHWARQYPTLKTTMMTMRVAVMRTSISVGSIWAQGRYVDVSRSGNAYKDQHATYISCHMHNHLDNQCYLTVESNRFWSVAVRKPDSPRHKADVMIIISWPLMLQITLLLFSILNVCRLLEPDTLFPQTCVGGGESHIHPGV